MQYVRQFFPVCSSLVIYFAEKSCQNHNMILTDALKLFLLAKQNTFLSPHHKKNWFLEVRENYCSRTSSKSCFKHNHFHAAIKWPTSKCSIIYAVRLSGYEFEYILTESMVNKAPLVSINSIQSFFLILFRILSFVLFRHSFNFFGPLYLRISKPKKKFVLG